MRTIISTGRSESVAARTSPGIDVALPVGSRAAVVGLSPTATAAAAPVTTTSAARKRVVHHVRPASTCGPAASAIGRADAVTGGTGCDKEPGERDLPASSRPRRRGCAVRGRPQRPAQGNQRPPDATRHKRLLRLRPAMSKSRREAMGWVGRSRSFSLSGNECRRGNFTTPAAYRPPHGDRQPRRRRRNRRRSGPGAQPPHPQPHQHRHRRPLRHDRLAPVPRRPAAPGLARMLKRRWVGWIVAVAPFTFLLYFFFQNLNRLLPPGL
jgi:hypothetical protein